MESYNKIFEDLVYSTPQDSVERLYGMLAYAEYKIDKHEWMSTHPNHSKEELKAFLSHYTKRTLDKYRSDAAQAFAGFGEDYAQKLITEEIIEIQKKEGTLEALKSLEARLNQEIKTTKVHYSIPVLQGVIASAIFTFLLFIIALLYTLAKPDTNAGRLLQYLIAPDGYEIKLIPKPPISPKK